MVLWIFGIIFFVITFGPRFYNFMNFKIGFYDLGLYTQFLSDLAQGFWNPYIPTLRNTFFTLRPQPVMLILWPWSFISTHPALFIFLDEAAVIVAAAVCANFVWGRIQKSEIAIATFVAVLFSPLYMVSLQRAGCWELWAQPFLALLFIEYFSKRRPLYLSLWFLLLTFVNLNFCVIGIALVPLLLITQRKRWKISRRAEAALPVAVISIFSAALLHNFQVELSFYYHYLISRLGLGLLTWLFSFWFLPILVPEVLIFSVLLLILVINGIQVGAILLVPLGAIGLALFLEKAKAKTEIIVKLASAGLIASTVYFNLVSPDPLLKFWETDRWSITEDNKKVHLIITHISPLESIAASEVFTPHLGGRLSLVCLNAINWAKDTPPNYILSRNEQVLDPHYKEIEGNSATGTRLLERFK